MGHYNGHWANPERVINTYWKKSIPHQNEKPKNNKFLYMQSNKVKSRLGRF